jgi:hypothetical protein
VGLLAVAGSFGPLLAWAGHAVREGFLPAEHRRALRVAAAPGALLAQLLAHRPGPAAPRWIDAADR